MPPIDELAAVNEMLESIGQTPVSSLDLSGLSDVTTAVSMLRRTTQAVQLHGFDFNTDDNYVLNPNTEGYLKVPEGVIRIDPMDVTSSLKRRKHPDGFWAIWDGENQTWVHADPVKFRVMWAFPFEEMPDAARYYVSLAAARKFQKRIIGSDALDGFNAEDEMRAWLILNKDERANRDTNLFRRNPLLAQVTANRRY